MVSDRPWIRTPLVESSALSKIAGCRVFLKLENLQPSGSFKSRGIGNLVRISSLSHEGVPAESLCFYSSSGGNAGLACVTSSSLLGHPSIVVVPFSTKKQMMDKIILAGAREVIQMGNTWFDADTYLRTQLLVERREKGEQAIYVPPFDHPDIWSGAASMITEIEEDLEGPADVVICSVGGGGLLCGLMQGLENSPTTTVIAVETVGADSLAQALAAGELITLPGIASIATTLGATRVAPQALRYAQQKNVQSLVVTDKQACGACVRFADSERMMVEPACGASLAAVYDGYLKDLQLSRDSKVVIVVCGGAGVTIDMLAEWRGMT